jgi:hypothetical protein
MLLRGWQACHRQAWRKAAMLSRKREIWGMALWVERRHGEGGWFYIAQQRDRLLETGDMDGVALWRAVAKRFDRLRKDSPPAAPS